MTFLNYSGSARGRGKGRGRGGGRGGRGRGYSRTPSAAFRGRGGGTNARKWVRTDIDHPDCKDASNNPNQENLTRRGRNQLILKPAPTAQRATTANVASALPTTMKRQGRNKLVSSDKCSNKKERSADEQEVLYTSGLAVATTSSLTGLAAVSTSDLEHSSKDTTDVAVLTTSNLKRHGRNKLSLPNSKKSKIDHSVQAGKRPPPWAAKRSGAKRIALHAFNPDIADGRSAKDNVHDDAGQDPPSERPVAEEKLTDFAYRETSKVIQRESKNRKWSLEDGGNAASAAQPNLSNRRSMGLVRVQPNAQKTPICTVFLKGVQCTDKYCRKRHDVPKEFSVPVCSFFQRHGQCLKGDACMFRHVKVNPRAMVCPSFALLGFCEDQGCAMKHVQSRPAMSGKRK